MKHSLISIILIAFAAGPSPAQWKSAGIYPAQVVAFGVHDTSFFASVAPFDQFPSYVYRYEPWTTGKWVESDNGMGFGFGNFSSFSSLGRYFFASAGGEQVTYESSNNGTSWLETTLSSVGSNGYYLFGTTSRPFTHHPFVVLSRDNGQSWDSVSTFNNWDWGVSFSAIGTCIFAIIGDTMWRSKDTGNTWTKLSPLFTGAMTVMDSLLFVTGNGNVIESADSGMNWKTVTVDSAGVKETVNFLVTDGKNLFAGTANGVLISTDIGKSWTIENGGITASRNVVAMGVFDTLLFIDVSGYYAYMRSIPEMTPTSVVNTVSQPAFDSLAVYPNPLTNTATITYSLANDARMNIIIYDALGRSVAIPVPSGEETAGDHEISFDARPLPSGIYWCILTAGSVKLPAKLVIQH